MVRIQDQGAVLLILALHYLTKLILITLFIILGGLEGRFGPLVVIFFQLGVGPQVALIMNVIIIWVINLVYVFVDFQEHILLKVILVGILLPALSLVGHLIVLQSKLFTPIWSSYLKRLAAIEASLEIVEGIELQIGVLLLFLQLGLISIDQLVLHLELLYKLLNLLFFLCVINVVKGVWYAITYFGFRDVLDLLLLVENQVLDHQVFLF